MEKCDKCGAEVVLREVRDDGSGDYLVSCCPACDARDDDAASPMPSAQVYILEVPTGQGYVLARTNGGPGYVLASGQDDQPGNWPAPFLAELTGRGRKCSVCSLDCEHYEVEFKAIAGFTGWASM